MNGADPRPIGGGAPIVGALSGASPVSVTLNTTATVRARIYDSATQGWSALTEGEYLVGVLASSASLVGFANPLQSAGAERLAGICRSDEYQSRHHRSHERPVHARNSISISRRVFAGSGRAGLDRSRYDGIQGRLPGNSTRANCRHVRERNLARQRRRSPPVAECSRRPDSRFLL